MIPPLDMAAVGHCLQRYIDVAPGTGIGVAAWLHSCSARTYQLLGFESFALKLFDDRKFIEHGLHIFTQHGLY